MLFLWLFRPKTRLRSLTTIWWPSCMIGTRSSEISLCKPSTYLVPDKTTELSSIALDIESSFIKGIFICVIRYLSSEFDWTTRSGYISFIFLAKQPGPILPTWIKFGNGLGILPTLYWTWDYLSVLGVKDYSNWYHCIRNVLHVHIPSSWMASISSHWSSISVELTVAKWRNMAAHISVQVMTCCLAAAPNDFLNQWSSVRHHDIHAVFRRSKDTNQQNTIESCIFKSHPDLPETKQLMFVL